MPKKASHPNRKTQPASTQPPAFSPLAMDQTMAKLQKLLANQDFQSIDEAYAYLQKLLQEHGGQVPEVAPSTPLEEAQALVAQAYEVTQPSRRRALAQQALALSPDCADAYAVLASVIDTAKLRGQSMFDTQVHLLGAPGLPYLSAQKAQAVTNFSFNVR